MVFNSLNNGGLSVLMCLEGRMSGVGVSQKCLIWKIICFFPIVSIAINPVKLMMKASLADETIGKGYSGR